MGDTVRVRNVKDANSKLGNLFRAAVEINCRISAWADRFARQWFGRISGLDDFSARIVPSLLRPGMKVLDVGAGRAPCLNAATIERLDLRVTGLDVSAAELASAPSGCYQATIVGDVGTAPLRGLYDLILSRAVLEHVADMRGAICNLSSALAEGGVMAHFMPCRNAPFAVLNRILGPRLSKRLLWSIYPETIGIAGFPAYYRDCAPTRLAASCRILGLDVVETTPYFKSEYLRFFAPAHLLDICRQVFLQTINATDFAETFVIVARKPATNVCSDESPVIALPVIRAATGRRLIAAG